MTETGSAEEIRLLREEVRLREESQIPMIPRAAKARMDRLEAEAERQASIVADVRTILSKFRVEDAEATVRAIAERVGYYLASSGGAS